jgi:sulfur dioxygenase
MAKSSNEKLIYRQLLDYVTFTYTYLLADPVTKKGVLIDPVFERVERDMKLAKELGIDLVYAINTHVHADHVTGSGFLRKCIPGLKSVLGATSGGKADTYVKHGDKLQVGELEIEARNTPGHTNGCTTFVEHKNGLVFTGDALFVRGCGRTDFQQGDSGKLYDAVHSQIFTLPDDFRILPGHDYNGFMESTVGEEKRLNPRLTKSREQFVQIMKDLKLDPPKQINRAVPLNLVDGVGTDLPGTL